MAVVSPVQRAFFWTPKKLADGSLVLSMFRLGVEPQAHLGCMTISALVYSSSARLLVRYVDAKGIHLSNHGLHPHIASVSGSVIR